MLKREVQIRSLLYFASPVKSTPFKLPVYVQFLVVLRFFSISRKKNIFSVKINVTVKYIESRHNVFTEKSGKRKYFNWLLTHFTIHRIHMRVVEYTRYRFISVYLSVEQLNRKFIWHQKTTSDNVLANS